MAVRVRPFNSREKERQAVCIVEMDGAKTVLHNPGQSSGAPHTFSYDFSYWSFDGFHDEDGLLVPDSDKYADQQKVYNDMGRGVFDAAMGGASMAVD